DIGNADPHVHRRRLRRIEADPATRSPARRRMAARAVAGAALAARRAGRQHFVLPGAADFERLVELGDEMQRVIALAPVLGQIAAEVAAGHRTTVAAAGRVDAEG